MPKITTSRLPLRAGGENLASVTISTLVLLMSWFFNGNENKRQAVRRTLNRLLNTSMSLESRLSLAPENDKRVDSRITRNTPVVVLPLDGVAEDLNLAVTTDLSSEGMALTSLGPIPTGSQLAVGIGDIEEEFHVFLAECVRSRPIGYGYFESGIRIVELLPAKRFDELKDLVQHLEKNPPTSLFALREGV